MRTNKKRVASSSVLLLTTVALTLFNGCTPSGPRAVLDGARLLREGRPDQAVPRLEDGVRQLPKNAQAWNYLGLAYHQSGRLTNAARAYQQALGLDRNLSAARFNLGCLSLDQGNVAGAVSEFTTFTVLQPGSAVGWTKLGSAQLRSRQWDAAERSFAQALRLNPASPEAWNGAGLVLVQKRRHQDALAQFQGALKVKPDYAPSLLNAAVVLQQNLNNRPAALQKYREYLAIKPAPPGSASVRELVDQMESELRPPARPVTSNLAPPLASSNPRPETNPPPVKPPVASITNKPPASGPAAVAAPTNAAPVASTAPAPAPAPTAKAPTTNASPANPSLVTSPPPAAPVEVVQVPREDPIQPVREPPVEASNRATTNASTTAKPASLPAGTVAAPANAAQVQPTTPKSKPKQPLIKKLNPVNWFRSKAPDTSTNVPASPTKPEVVSQPEVTKIPNIDSGADKLVAAAPPEPARAPVPLPSYSYHSFGKPNPGDRSEAERWINAGVKARERNRNSEAVDAFQKAVAADPSLFEAHYNLGVALFEAGDYRTALPAYEQALAINPASVKARYNFAITLQKTGFTADAANELEKVVARNPDEAIAHLELANLYAGLLNQPVPAGEHYRAFLRLQPRSPQAASVRYWLETHP